MYVLSAVHGEVICGENLADKDLDKSTECLYGSVFVFYHQHNMQFRL